MFFQYMKTIIWFGICSYHQVSEIVLHFHSVKDKSSFICMKFMYEFNLYEDQE